MTRITEIEHIKNAAYTAVSLKKSVVKGLSTFDEAKQVVLKWMNFGLPEGQHHDMKKYFDKEVSGHGAVMQETRLRKQAEKEAWEALEFFGLI